jgi:hypothetical protein
MGMKLGLSLIVWEEHRLRVFENRLLAKILGAKKEEGIRGWRKLHNEELHIICALPQKILRWSNQGE